jgi:peroxiredoxin
MLKIGDAAPEVSLRRPDGTPARLTDFEAPALLVVFLRHLACIACRAHLGEVEKVYPDIRASGGEVIAVSFTKPERLAAVLRIKPLSFPALSDPGVESYHAFGLGRTTWLDILRPGVLLRFGKMMLHGWMPKQPNKGEDVLQLGGDFILDRQRRIAYVYRSLEPTDRPSGPALLEAVRRAATS